MVHELTISKYLVSLPTIMAAGESILCLSLKRLIDTPEVDLGYASIFNAFPSMPESTFGQKWKAGSYNWEFNIKLATRLTKTRGSGFLALMKTLNGFDSEINDSNRNIAFNMIESLFDFSEVEKTEIALGEYFHEIRVKIYEFIFSKFLEIVKNWNNGGI